MDNKIQEDFEDDDLQNVEKYIKSNPSNNSGGIGFDIVRMLFVPIIQFIILLIIYQSGESPNLFLFPAILIFILSQLQEKSKGSMITFIIVTSIFFLIVYFGGLPGLIVFCFVLCFYVSGLVGLCFFKITKKSIQIIKKGEKYTMRDIVSCILWGILILFVFLFFLGLIVSFVK